MYGVIDKMPDGTLEQYDHLACTWNNHLWSFQTYREAMVFALSMQMEGEAKVHFTVVPLPGIKGK